METVQELMKKAEGNFAVFDSMSKADSVIKRHDRIAVSVSGGKDSDIMLDLIWRLDKHKKAMYVWFDTGLEYQATKDHLSYLEERYGIEIVRERAEKPIPLSCKQYGQPFWSKQASDMIYRLQYNGFQFEDEPYEVLLERYPRCKGALDWWCNKKPVAKNGHSMYNINFNPYLKEFLVAFPPQFKISNKCCTYAKKNVSKKFIKENEIDCMVQGVRRAEGGVRATAYKTCFTANEDGCDQYRPLYWYKQEDEAFYDELFEIKHSACYEEWGLARTGCVGCPYNKKIFEELATLSQHEPNLVTAARVVFRESYEYTQHYLEYRESRKQTAKYLDEVLGGD